MDIRFEWNPQKESANRRTHGVSFEEALTTFFDPGAKGWGDEEHS